jgi:hypothetical protein
MYATVAHIDRQLLVSLRMTVSVDAHCGARM